MTQCKKSDLLRSPRKLVFVVTLLLSPVSASAYLDPSTGSMLISAIVGLFASLVLALRTYWYRIKSFFRRGRADTHVDD